MNECHRFRVVRACALIAVLVLALVGAAVAPAAANPDDKPQDLVDASKIDGASWFQTVKNVVTPIITPVITIVIILNIIGGFRVFDLVYIMTSGGPARASEVISTYIVWNAFSSTSAGYYGYASALSMYLIFITAIFVYLRVRLTRRSEEEIE